MVSQPASSSVNTFLFDLIQEKHGTSLAEDTKEEMFNDLKPRLDEWITLKSMTEIAQSSPADLETLQTMTEENKSTEEIQAFIKAKIPDITTFLTKTLLSFRQSYLGV